MHAMKLNAHAAGSSCAAITGLAYVVCAAAYALFPSATLAFFNYVFHGLDFRKVAVGMTWGGAVAGLLIAVVGAYVLTWLWATWYNRMCCSGGATGDADDCCKNKESGGSEDCCRK